MRNEGPNSEQGKGPVSSTAAKNPIGGADDWRVTGKPDPNDYLLEKILSRPNMLTAWKRVKANKGAPGIDKMTVDDFLAYAQEHWDTIRASLLAGTYQPLPVKRVEIPKPTGDTRPLGIPSVLDRLIQQSIAQVLQPIFDPHFSESSFGFRLRRSAHNAVHQVRDFIRTGYRVAVDADLSKFFDTVDHDVLMCRVARRVRDKRVLRLIGRYLRAGVEINGRLEDTRKGVPQGGPLSPLLANILLDDLDKELEQRGHWFCRYADDFIILVEKPSGGRTSDGEHLSLPRATSQTLDQPGKEQGGLDQRDLLSRIHLQGCQYPLVRQGIRRVQTASPKTDRAELGSLYGVPFCKACGIPSRLDGILRDIGILSSASRSRSLAAAAGAYVLYKAMALVPYQGPRTC